MCKLIKLAVNEIYSNNLNSKKTEFLEALLKFTIILHYFFYLQL